MSDSTFLYPNVTSLPGQSGIGQSDRASKKQDGSKAEFDQVFEQAMDKAGKSSAPGQASTSPLDQIKAPLKFSAHASQRLKDRKITLDQATLTKVNEAVEKADSKGIDDTLVLTKDAALIVNVKNRTVITAMDHASMKGNVFTNIDGAVIV